MSGSKRARKSGASRRSRSKSRQESNATQMRSALQWLLQKASFNSFSFHGNTSWRPADLVTLTLLWVWSPSPKLTEAFDDARIQTHQLTGSTAVTSYQGLAKALETWTDRFMHILMELIHRLMVEIGGKHLRRGKWCPIAIDGSRVTTPRTVSNEQAFCAKNYGKGKTAKYRKKKTKGMRRKKNERNKPQPQAPQIWVTLMWHMGLGLPWCWKLGPSNSSERQHVIDLIDTGHFLDNTLFVGDAGFVGYDFWKAIHQQGHSFMVRVGANVSLLRDLGYQVELDRGKKGIVYCWPGAAMQRKQQPLTLRLVQAHLGKKKQKVWLLTNVLDEQDLTPQEMVRLYELRWGIELEFRGLKQTFECRKLRSRKSERALAELDWAIFGMTVIQLFALKEQLKNPQADPHKLSLAKSARAVRRSLAYLHERPEQESELRTQLAAALSDDYERRAAKAARYKPQKKDKPSCGEPKIKKATADHKQRLRKILEYEHKQAA